MKLIDWILGLFSKPKEEVTFTPEEGAWPFPAPVKKKKLQVKKATTRKAKPAVKKPAAKKVVTKKAK